MKNTNIQSLLKSYLTTGSEDSLTQFFQAISPLMYQVAFKYTKNSADAEDALQNAILYIIEKREECKKICDAEEASVKAWCLKIVINMAKMKIRQRKSRSKRETIVQDRRDYENKNNDLNAKNQAENSSKELTETLEELPEKYRIPIYLKYYEGFSLKDIALSLSLNQNTLRSNVKRGMDQLSGRLKAKGVILSTAIIISMLGQIDLKAATHPAIENLVKNAINEGISGKRYQAAYHHGSSVFFKISLALLISLAVLLTFQHSLTHVKNPFVKDIEQSQSALIFYQWSFNNGIPKGLSVASFNYTPTFARTPFQIHPKFNALHSNNGNMLQITIDEWIDNEIIEFDYVLASQSHKRTRKENSMANRIKLIEENGKANHGKVIFSRQYTIEGTVSRGILKEPFMRGIKSKAYFVNHHIFIFMEGELVNICRFEKEDGKIKPVFILRNFGITKISMKELKTPPKSIAKLLKNIPRPNPKRLIINHDKLQRLKDIHLP